MTGTILFILKGYPRLSETFIAQELLGLERAGLRFRILSMRHPTDTRVHPVHREINSPVSYLPEYLHDDPIRVLKAAFRCFTRPGLIRVLRQFFSDFRREPTRNRLRRLGQAFVIAAEATPDVTQLHAHFIHTPASVTFYAATLLGLPWSCSAHAKDIWTTPEIELRAKLADAAWIVTCTRSGADYLSALAPPQKPVELIYHGLDLDRFRGLNLPRSARNGLDPSNPVQLLAVGRAVEKKGFDLLLAALALLPNDLHWRFTHIGGGDRLAALRQQAEQLGLSGKISWLGAQPQEEVLAAYRAADLFVLPCRIADDGDRDGLPNVLMEAQSQSLTCLSTTVSGVPELVTDGETGLLVPPEDVDSLAEALKALILDPERRYKLGKAAERRVRSKFDHCAGIRRLAERFGIEEPTALARQAAAE